MAYRLCGTRGLLCMINTYNQRMSSSIPVPPPDGTKLYPEKLHNLVQEISQLTLKETAQLNELLKTTLNISDVSVMAASSIPVASQAPSEEPKEKVEEKSTFSVKLVKYSADSKIKIIKEIKSLMEDMNLVQAKKFVESVPQVLKENVSKEEAEKLKVALETLGGEVDIE